MTEINLLPAASKHKVKNISIDPPALSGSHKAQLTEESWNLVNIIKILTVVLNVLFSSC